MLCLFFVTRLADRTNGNQILTSEIIEITRTWCNQIADETVSGMCNVISLEVPV